MADPQKRGGDPDPKILENRAAAAVLAGTLEHMVRQHLAPVLCFLAEANERASLISFGSSTERWLVVMVTRELVDQMSQDIDELQKGLRAAAAGAGIAALDVRRRAAEEPPAPQPEPQPIHGFATAPPTLEEAQALVGGTVELLFLDNGDQLLVNEDGRATLPVNAEASLQWPKWGPLFGPVVHLQGKARWK